MARFESLRVQYRWCGRMLRVTWVLLFATAGWAFHENVRTGFMVLLAGFSLITVQLLVRDYISRRMEQRRKPRRVKELPAVPQTETAGVNREEEQSFR